MENKIVYCVEDDASIRDIEVYALKSVGYEVTGLADGEALMGELARTRPALIVLDVMLPGRDGLEILKSLRNDARYREIPVILATARDTELDKITGLDLGADYYLAKPFGVMELVSCVRAVLRRAGTASAGALLTLDGIVLNDSEKTVTVRDEPVTLTLKEFELLKTFMSHPGFAYTRDQLLAQVWEDVSSETRTVDMHVKTLRQKLGPCGAYIETVRGVGYKMVAHD